jgi:transcriptional regulator with XRE-family HTH domain
MTARRFHIQVRNLAANGLTMGEVAEALGMTIPQYQYWKRKAEKIYPPVRLKRKVRKDRMTSGLELQAHDGTCVEFVTWA